MIRALFALSGAMIAGGIYSVIAGLDYIVLERGWTMVLAGTTLATGGAILLGLSLLVREVARQAPSGLSPQIVTDASRRTDIMDRLAAMRPATRSAAMPGSENGADVAATRLQDDILASRQEPRDEAEKEPGITADTVADAPRPAPAGSSLLDRLAQSRLTPRAPAPLAREPDGPARIIAERLAASGITPPAYDGPDASPRHMSADPEAIRVGASVAGIVVTSALPPPDAPGTSDGDPPTDDHDDLGPFVMEPEDRPQSEREDDLQDVPAPLPGMSQADRLIPTPPLNVPPSSDLFARGKAPSVVSEQPVHTADDVMDNIPTTEPDGSDADLFADDSVDHDAPPAPEPSVVGSYAAGGHTYVMYSDGSILAETATGTFRFASIDELKAYISTGEMPARVSTAT